MIKEFYIPEQNIAALEAKFQKLHKRSVKIGAVSPTIKKGITFTEPRQTEAGVKYLQKFIKVVIEFEPITTNGWTWVAILQHLPEGNIVRNIGLNELPAKYRNAGPNCEHCKINRQRNDTYVVHRVIDNQHKYVQVGKTCLQEFLEVYPAIYASRAEIIKDALVFAEASETLPSTGTSPTLWPLENYLSYVTEEIMANGWVSKSQAWKDHTVPTSKIAFDRMLDINTAKPSDASKDEAAAAIEWTESLPEYNLTEYLHNIRTIAMGGAVEVRTTGYAASIISTYRQQNRPGAIRVGADKPSEWFGEVGKRDIFSLTVDKIVAIDTSYGEKFLHIMHDQNGNIAVWWKTGDSLDEGKQYTLKASVKEHKLFKDTKQTILSHCKLVS